jgi:GGDEF domain-containing protein
VNILVIDERISKKVEEPGLEFEGKTFNVTLSGGIAPYSADRKGAQDLVHPADVALYQAKESG